MITYRVYVRPVGSTKAKPKLAATDYNEIDAARTAGRLALAGWWVRVTQNESPDPSRCD